MDMTKREAISSMLEGKKVTHRYFSDNEYLFMKGDFRIYTEEGYYASDEEFWKDRQGEEWQIDWRIYTD